MLQRIVVLLLSLADLADQAAGRSLATRRRVMWSLWHANAVAADFVMTSTDPDFSSFEPSTIRYSEDPADAMALAVSLRWLALVVHGMAARRRSLKRTHPDSASRDQNTAVLVLAQGLLSVLSMAELYDSS